MREARSNTHKDYMNKNGEIDNIKKGILAGDGEEVKKTGVKAVENKVGYPFRTDKKLYARSGYKISIHGWFRASCKLSGCAHSSRSFQLKGLSVDYLTKIIQI